MRKGLGSDDSERRKYYFNKETTQSYFHRLSHARKSLESKPHHYTQEDLAEARTVLTGLLPSIENIYAKSKVGSPQRTLLERRIKALELAVQAIDDLSNE